MKKIFIQWNFDIDMKRIFGEMIYTLNVLKINIFDFQLYNRIVLIATKENIKSRRVAEKC